MSADIPSRLVDHPQFRDWLLDLYPRRSKGFKVGVRRYEHVLEDSLPANSYKAKLDELLCFSAGAK
jgi:hypothetical protein